MLRNTLAAALMSVGALSASQANPINISLDGYCNTFAIQGGVAYYGSRGGCGSTITIGGTGVIEKGVKHKLNMVLGDSEDGTHVMTWVFERSNLPKKHRWWLYESDGTASTLLNSGTYTESPGPMAASGTLDAAAH